jgi:hypothetical protein
MLSGSIDPHYAIAGFLVGALVGVTGVGGGSLMTPILIVLFGVSPATAVGTDLLFAAATKTVGSLVHGFNRTIDWRVVRRLATGSIPATALALMMLSWLNMRTGGAHQMVTAVLSIALFLTAGALIARNKIFSIYSQRLANLNDRSIAPADQRDGCRAGNSRDLLVRWCRCDRRYGFGAPLSSAVDGTDRWLRYRARGPFVYHFRFAKKSELRKTRPKLGQACPDPDQSPPPLQARASMTLFKGGGASSLLDAAERVAQERCCSCASR